MAVVFFDIGGTLADASITPDGALSFRPLPRVRESLAAVTHERLGILSNPGPTEADRRRAAAALAATFDVFTDPTLVRWGSKTTRVIFDDAVAAAGVGADKCVFVGEDPDERARAREAGMRCVAHPVFARAGVEGRAVFWVRIDATADPALADVVDANEVVPANVGVAEVLAMATEQGAEAVRDAGFAVTILEPVDDTVAFLVRDDRPLPPGFDATGFDATERTFTSLAEPSLTRLGAGDRGVHVAARAGIAVEEMHIPRTGHGHCELLLPDPALLRGEAVTLDAVALAPSAETVEVVRRVVTEAAMREVVAQISGALPLAGRTVRGRHIASADNMPVVDELARRLVELGLSVRRQPFEWRGHRIDNVEAEFAVAGSDATVLVTAHIDSTAAAGRFVDDDGQPRQYDPTTDPAPGADDDGSGAAAVLATARCLRDLLDAGRTPTRTLRFVLFNAEEQGLVGSKVYARAAAAAGDRIAGVLQMDMIAGHRGGAAKVEVHAGSATPGPAVAASRTLGAMVADGLAKVVPDFEVQLLADAADPAAGRSDHASFHERGWAAVAVSENFFADVEPESGTRQYHMPGDTVDDVDHDSQYCAQIARGVAATALTLAGL